MLPRETSVLLVDADGVLDRPGFAVDLVEVSVEILNDAETVAAEPKRVRELAHAVFADVEDVLAEVPALGRAIWYGHFDDRGAMDDWTAVEADVVQRQ